MSDDTYADVMRRGLIYECEKPVRLDDGAESLRLIVHDLNSGALGSVTLPLRP